MWNVEDLMIEADMRGGDGSYEAVVDTLAALGDDARKARKERAMHNANSPEEMHEWLEAGDGLICRCGLWRDKESEPSLQCICSPVPGGLLPHPHCPEHGDLEHLGKPYK